MIELRVYLSINRPDSIGIQEYAPEFGDIPDIIWLPKSQIETPMEMELEEDSYIDIEIPTWLATEKGLV